jgi:hypothetical protein
MRSRLLVLTLLGAAVPTPVTWAAVGSAAKAPTYAEPKTVTAGGVKITYPRRSVVVGRSPKVLPITMAAKAERLTHVTLTRQGAATPVWDQKTAVLGSKVAAIGLPASAKAGSYALSITITRSGQRVGRVRDTIALR